MPLKWLLGQNSSSSVFPEGTDASFLGASEWRKQEAGCSDTCSWGVALLKPAQLVPPQVSDALSIGNGDHRPWSIEKHHIRSAQGRPLHHMPHVFFFHSGKSNPYCEISSGLRELEEEQPSVKRHGRFTAMTQGGKVSPVGWARPPGISLTLPVPPRWEPLCNWAESNLLMTQGLKSLRNIHHPFSHHFWSPRIVWHSLC